MYFHRVACPVRASYCPAIGRRRRQRARPANSRCIPALRRRTATLPCDRRPRTRYWRGLHTARRRGNRRHWPPAHPIPFQRSHRRAAAPCPSKRRRAVQRRQLPMPAHQAVRHRLTWQTHLPAWPAPGSAAAIAALRTLALLAGYWPRVGRRHPRLGQPEAAPPLLSTAKRVPGASRPIYGNACPEGYFLHYLDDCSQCHPHYDCIFTSSILRRIISFSPADFGKAVVLIHLDSPGIPDAHFQQYGFGFLFPRIRA